MANASPELLPSGCTTGTTSRHSLPSSSALSWPLKNSRICAGVAAHRRPLIFRMPSFSSCGGTRGRLGPRVASFR
eukprot:scaffold48_cov311-Pinguiococcus_pyrenoidosus.AAC.99